MKTPGSSSRPWLLALSFLSIALPHALPGGEEPSGELLLHARRRAPGGGDEVLGETLRWEPARTALILCDLWNAHWCAGATRRVAAMAPRIDAVARALRGRGALIIHSPSSCMEFYAGTPQRRRALEAPRPPSMPEGIGGWCSRLPGEPPLPIDDSDGGCDCDPPCPHGAPWRRQIETIEVAPEDAVSDSGEEIWSLLEARGIQNVILAGVHTNMCVSGRPFGLRQMAKNGKSVVLLRDLTDSMYNSRRPPFVSHRRGTELIIQHVERHLAPSAHSRDLLGDSTGPRVLVLTGEEEYNTHETIPAFCARELAPGGLRVTAVDASGEDPDAFPGLEALREADLLVLSVRRRTPTFDQMALLREYLDSGRPLVAVRTASHSFDREASAGHASWSTFDQEVLGHTYEGHYGNKPPSGPDTIVKIAPAAAGHPLLAGLPDEPLRFTSHLYRVRALGRNTRALAMGTLGEDASPAEPVALAATYRGSRVFYTSLGSPSDFESPAFRTLLRNAVYWALELPVPPSTPAPPAPPRASTPSASLAR